MKIFATHMPTARTTTFEFTEPGGTIGRCPGNHLLLDEDARVGRVQAVMRIKDQAWSIMNVSSRTDMALNGKSLNLLKELPITLGDTLTVGDYMLRTTPPATSESAITTAVPEPVAEQEPAATAQDEPDIFRELLDGPGVLPVGQSVEASNLHPFEITSQAPRNHPDPIQTLQGFDQHTPTYGSLTDGSLNTEPEHHDSHILSNPTPSTLNLNDALGTQRKSLIDDTLAQGHASDRLQEKL